MWGEERRIDEEEYRGKESSVAGIRQKNDKYQLKGKE